MTDSLPAPFFIFLFGFILFSFYVPFVLRIEADNLRDNKIIQLKLNIMIFYRLNLASWHKKINWWDVLQKKINLTTFQPDPETEYKNELLEKIGKDILVNCLKNAINHITIYFFKLHLKVGTGDAAWTAILTGLIHAASHFIALKVKGLQENAVYIEIQPSFLKKELSVHLQFKCSFNAIRLLLILFECTKTFISLTIQFYRRRNKCQIDPYRV